MGVIPSQIYYAFDIVCAYLGDSSGRCSIMSSSHPYHFRGAVNYQARQTVLTIGNNDSPLLVANSRSRPQPLPKIDHGTRLPLSSSPLRHSPVFRAPGLCRPYSRLLMRRMSTAIPPRHSEDTNCRFTAIYLFAPVECAQLGHEINRPRHPPEATTVQRRRWAGRTK